MQSSTNDYESRSTIFNLPKKYYDKTYSNFETKTDKLAIIKNKCYDYALGRLEKRSLIMVGNVGSGKTHLAVMIAKNLPNVLGTHGERKQIVKFINADEMFTMFNDLVHEKKSKLEYINELLLCDLLIIDDLGVANYTPAKQENLYLLINRAYLDEKRIIITTNFTLEQLAKFDERVVSRLVEMAEIIRFTDKDYRTK